MLNQELLIKVKETVISVAEGKRMTAGYSGEHHDGGAKALLKELEVFTCGINQKFPESWEEYVKASERELEIEELRCTQEYTDYLLLKEKYGHLD